MNREVKRVPLMKAALPQLTRVAAYARVSSAKDAMRHSLSAQVSYYSDLIQRHPGWAYAGVYADEAKTGTKDSRENFVRLIDDCRAGRIDAIIPLCAEHGDAAGNRPGVEGPRHRRVLRGAEHPHAFC